MIGEVLQKGGEDYSWYVAKGLSVRPTSRLAPFGRVPSGREGLSHRADEVARRSHVSAPRRGFVRGSYIAPRTTGKQEICR
jgi:hypothetical protein